MAPHVEERKRGSFSLSSETMTLAELVVGGLLFIAAEFFGLIPEAYYLYVWLPLMFFWAAGLFWLPLKIF